MHTLLRSALVVLAVSSWSCGSKSTDVPDAGADVDSGVVDAGVDAGQTEATSSIDATGGAVTLGALRVVVPAGALGAATTLTVRQTTDVPQVADVTPLSPVFEFGPNGTQFTGDISVAFDVTPAQAGEVQLVYWTNAAGDFEPLPSWWSTEGRVYARPTHFSRGFVGKPIRAPLSLSCGAHLCVPVSPRQTLDNGASPVFAATEFTARMDTEVTTGPRKLEVRDTPVRPADVDAGSYGAVFDLKMQPFMAGETVELCVRVPTDTDAGGACLAYFDDGNGTWKCQDECLKGASDGGSFLCGKTDHFTSFAVLLGGSGASSTQCR